MYDNDEFCWCIVALPFVDRWCATGLVPCAEFAVLGPIKKQSGSRGLSWPSAAREACRLLTLSTEKKIKIHALVQLRLLTVA